MISNQIRVSRAEFLENIIKNLKLEEHLNLPCYFENFDELQLASLFDNLSDYTTRSLLLRSLALYERFITIDTTELKIALAVENSEIVESDTCYKDAVALKKYIDVCAREYDQSIHEMKELLLKSMSSDLLVLEWMPESDAA